MAVAGIILTLVSRFLAKDGREIEQYGGEGGIRTPSGLRQSVTCRMHVAMAANKASVAVAHRPISPDDYLSSMYT